MLNAQFMRWSDDKGDRHPTVNIDLGEETGESSLGKLTGSRA